VPFLKKQLSPAKRGDPERIAKLLADLDDNNFSTREKASQELEQLGSQAALALQKFLKGNPPLEAKRRAEHLLAKLDQRSMSRQQVRTLRAIQVLQRINTPEAREVLNTLQGR